MRVQRVWRGLLLAAGGLVVGLLLIEVCLRLGAPLLRPPMRWILTDEADRMHYVTERTSRGHLLISGLLPADLLAVGDSFVFGSMIPEEQGWIARLSTLTHLRAINLGVPATGPRDYNRMLEVGLQSRPRMILYGIFSGHVRASARSASSDPLWLRRADFWQSPLAYFTHTVQVSLSRSLSLQMVKYLLYQPTYRHASYRFEGGGLAFMFSGVDYWGPLLDPDNPMVQAGMDRLVEVVGEADQRAKAAGAALVAVLIPHKEMVYVPVLQSQGLLTSDEAARLWSPRFDATFDVIKAGLTRRGIRTLDLREGFRRSAAQGAALYLRVDGHWNEAGNDLAARLAAEYLDQHRDALLSKDN